MASFSSGTLLSRITGFARDVVTALIFGDHPAIAAFMVAFRLSHLLRRLLGEGPLSSTFIPQFQAHRSTSPPAASAFFITASRTLAIVVFGCIAFGELALFPFATNEVVHLSMQLLPTLLFVALYGLYTAFLHCHDTYFLPSVTPALCNLAWIGGVWLWRDTPPHLAVTRLAWIVGSGFALQWIAILPNTSRILARYEKGAPLPLFHPHIVRLGKLAMLGIIGIGASQIGSACDALFARWVDPKAPAHLWYALRLEQLPLALIGIACTSALLPRISRAIAQSNRDEERHLIQLGLRLSMRLLIPATLVLIGLSKPIITLLFGYGSHSPLFIPATHLALQGYAIGLIPSALSIFFTGIAYAKERQKRASWIAASAIGCNIVLNALFLLVWKWEATSIALATSLSMWGSCLLLWWYFGRGLYMRNVGIETLASLCSGGCMLALGKQLVFANPLLEVGIAGMLIAIGSFGGSFAASTLMSRRRLPGEQHPFS